MSRIFHCHEKLTAGRDGPMVNKQPLHLRQGILDMACGPHCALMALMLMGELQRDELDELDAFDGFLASRNPALTKFWKRSTGSYFSGFAVKQLQSLFKPYQGGIKSRILRKQGRLGRVVDCIEMGGLCILGIHNEEFSHWLLLVGFSTYGDSARLDKLLLLDPDSPTVPLTPWNATLTTTNNGRGMCRFETSELSTKVVFDTALALMPITSC